MRWTDEQVGGDREEHVGGGHDLESQRGDSGTVTGRAAALGMIGTALSGAATVWLALICVRDWPGWGQVEPAIGLGFLTGAGAALLVGWVSVQLGLASADLLRAGEVDRPGELRPVVTGPPPVTSGEGGLVRRRLAALLLTLATLGGGAASATALPQVQPQPQHAPTTLAASLHPAAVAPSAGTVAGVIPSPSAGAMPSPSAVEAPTEESVTVPRPGWTPTPERPRPRAEVSLVSTAASDSGQAISGEGREVVVRPGDSLWAIAARHLGPEASAQDVAEAWPRWYAANRDLIGPDPDLILPGQRLAVPAGGLS